MAISTRIIPFGFAGSQDVCGATSDKVSSGILVIFSTCAKLYPEAHCVALSMARTA